MTVTYYRSDDASAPALYGSVNSTFGIVNLLDKCLVSGYGSKSAAGWTKPYTGTNVACFLQGGSGGAYLAVDDSTTLTSRVTGYEAMTSATVGTGPFPTAAQLSGGGYIHRSTVADTTQRAWVMIADSTFFCLVINSDGGSGSCSALMFGAINSYRTSDAYHKILICGPSATASANVSADTSALGTAVAGHYMARSYTQLGSSITVGKHSDTVKAGLAYPHPVDGGLYLGPLWVHENALSVVRGTVRGVWIPLHTGNRPLAHGDTFSGTGALSGKTFVVQHVPGTKSLFLETSDTW